jgi:hypothetical protein
MSKDPHSKKIHPNSMIGQKGINLLERKVLEMGFVWYPSSGIEAGIDGIIEIRDSETGNMSNAIIQVQSKATEKPFQAETSEGFDYLCEERDLNYWLEGNTPVILVVSRPNTEEIYWISIKDYFRDVTLRKTRKVHFNKQQDKFDQACRMALASLAAPQGIGLFIQNLLAAFAESPVHDLPPVYHADGVGVYGLYYSGDYELYTTISEQNRTTCEKPIYIGKAVSQSRRIGVAGNQNVVGILGKLREHAQSINAATNLKIEDFQCRFLFIGEANNEEETLIEAVETRLIKKFQPLWNSSCLTGFGLHNPGAGRYNQLRSTWDILHPGRSWASKLHFFSDPTRLDLTYKRIRQFLASPPIS